jgi:TetR/AcrR family transcriptional regulator, tetracycline repressor protein
MSRQGNALINRESIVTEAIALLNEEGLDGISLRKLASRLGVKAPSLYWHFPDKSALLAAVCEQIFNRCLDAVPPSRSWQPWMRAFGATLWKEQQNLRDFGRLVTTTALPPEQLARTDQRIRLKVADLDLPEDVARRMQSSVQALITGWSAFAHAPYADQLVQSFEATALEDLEALLAGWALQLARRRP